MNVQRSLGFVLVALQAAALAYCFRTPIFSTVMVGAALVGWLSKIRLVSPQTAQRWPIVLAVLYIVQWAVVPPDWYSGRSSFFSPHSCPTAEYFLVFQVAQFFVRREGDRLPSYLPILTIVAMTFAGDVQVRGNQRLVFQVFSLGLVALTAGFFAACRLRDGDGPAKPLVSHRVLLGIVLLLSGTIGWVAASNLHRHERKIEAVFGAVMNPRSRSESVGFSGQGRLGSVARVKGRSGSRVALRVWSENSPGYLRGRAFDTYDRAEWHSDGQRAILTPDRVEDSPWNVPSDQSDNRTFSLPWLGSGTWNRQEIWPNQAFQKVVFVPPGLVALQIPVDSISIDMHGIVEADDLPSGTPYVAGTSDAAIGLPIPTDVRDDPTGIPDERLQRISRADWDCLMALPEDLDPRVRELAVGVAGRSTTASEKIAAVERYFLDNYQYQFGINIPAGMDPLTYFLLEKPPGHCEYFASGAAVLLRAVGVPCRYVTGFVAAEWNDFGDYWIARNRDAHAWVEAYDHERGWVVVEATPASGFPQEISPSAASQAWDALLARWQRLVASIRQGGVRAILGALWRWFTRPAVLLALLLAASVFASRWIWRHRSRSRAVQRDPCLDQLQRLLSQMDRRWRKAGLARQPHETLHQFAERVSSASPDSPNHQAAQWYRQFAAIRYSGRTDADSVKTLQTALAANADADS